MKWVKVAIGAVIAILSVSIIATSVYDMTQEKHLEIDEIESEILISFNVTNEPGGTSRIIDTDVESYLDSNFDYFTENIDRIYLILYKDGQMFTKRNVSDIQSITTAIQVTLEYDNDTNLFNFDGTTLSYQSNTFDFWGISELSIGDSFEFVYYPIVVIPAQLTGITATLILLTPLIFAGGVLAYLLNKQEL